MRRNDWKGNICVGPQKEKKKEKRKEKKRKEKK